MTFGQNDPDSNIFQYCMPSGQADTATPGAPAPTTKRQRPDPQAKFRGGRRHPFGPSSQQALLPSAPIQDPTLRLTSKLLLRHEEALAMQRKEKNFALFFPRCLLVSMSCRLDLWRPWALFSTETLNLSTCDIQHSRTV
eukprot:s2616_g5.t1